MSTSGAAGGGGKVGSYRLSKLLYEGSSVKVYEGESVMNDKVAIKQCKAGSSKKEVETLLKLKRLDSDCKHVVKIIDCIENTTLDEAAAHAADSTMSSFLIFELGQVTLDAWLRERQYQPSWAEMLEVGQALGQALEWIHGHDLVHSDVKPANCMLVGRLWKLVDFAAAAKEGDRCTELTSTYVAPEQARAFLAGEAVLASKDADVWAYGKVLFEMACGMPTSLVSEHADTADMPTVLQDIAALRGDLVAEHRMRFPVLRSVLRETLKVDTPRASMTKVVNKGLWSGAETAPLQQQEVGGQKRRKAIEELVETEVEYCKRLEELVNKFVEPLLRSHEEGAVELESEQLRVLTDLENLLRANKFFLSNLKTRFEREGSSCIGSIMIEFARTLLMNYQIYVSRFLDSCDLLQDAKRDSRKFQAIISEGVGDDAALNAYLILPVQRLMRYKILLEAIVHRTPETGADPQEFKDLQEALLAVTDTVDKINDSQPETLQHASLASRRRRQQRVTATGVIVAGAIGVAAIAIVFYYIREKNSTMRRIHEITSQQQAALEAQRHAIEIEAMRAQAAAAHAEATKAQETTKTVTVLGVLSAAAAVLLFSDRRLKTRVTRHATSQAGLPVYRFAYIWDPATLYEGVMAQDLLARTDAARHAVRRLPDGWLAVDYSLIDVVPQRLASDLDTGSDHQRLDPDSEGFGESFKLDLLERDRG